MFSSAISLPDDAAAGGGSSPRPPFQRCPSFIDRILGIQRRALPQPPELERYREVVVEAPITPASQFGIEGLFNAVTEGSTMFARRHIQLVHNEDPTTVYSVREVRIECRDAPAQFLRDVVALPQAVRNRVIKNRIQKAPGVQGLLRLDEFYGCTLLTDSVMADGAMVQTLVSWSGNQFDVRICFDGDYITVDPEAAPASPEPQAEATDVQQTDGDNPALYQTMIRRNTPGAAHASAETPLHSATGRVTPAIAVLRLRNGAAEATVPLHANGFPYIIGRHQSSRGYCVTGQKDVEGQAVLDTAEPPGAVSFVSREHLVLESYDESTHQFRVNTAKGRNGTFSGGLRTADRFLLALNQDKHEAWLRLGGLEADGILDICVERV
ncbi:MAG: hypothetical protein LCH79_20630 [Proteobacteria bacterium]|nr:hypothetical protein [Pseudomonadota bacterium]